MRFTTSTPDTQVHSGFARTARFLALLLMVLFFLPRIASATGGPDIWMHDCSADVGNEPDPSSTCSIIWASPDIKCQTQQGYSTSLPHSAEAGQDNYVYVDLWNRGTGMVSSGQVCVYWAKFAANQVWSSGWINNHDANGYLIGDQIGCYTLSASDLNDLSNNGTVRIEMLWPAANVPDPTNWGESHTHVCLVARFVSNDDPMTFPEGSNMLDNTRNNNNIAWKNLDICKSTKRTTHIIVGNTTNNNATFNLHFSEDNPSGLGFVGNHGNVTVDLGGPLHALCAAYANWNNVTDFDPSDPNNTRVVLTGADASLDNIPFAAGEVYTIAVTFDESQGQDILNGHAFNWQISQEIPGNAEPFGGVMVTYDLTSGQQEGKSALAPNSEAAKEYHLSARPNPSAGSTTISYTLPGAATVKVEVYDNSGRLVRTLLRSTEQREGAHEIEWNGQNEVGAPVPNGTYFYRLVAGEKMLEGQVKVVR